MVIESFILQTLEAASFTNHLVVPWITLPLMDGSKWVLSGLTIMNRQMILDGECPPDYYYKTDWVDLAVNVNTMYELQLARGYFG